MKSLALKFLGCTLLFLAFTAKAQMSSQNMKTLNGFTDATVYVMLYDDECKKCKEQRAANEQIRNSVNTFFTVNKNIEFVKQTKENIKKFKEDKKTEKYFLEPFTVTITHNKNNGAGGSVGGVSVSLTSSSNTYLHYFYLSKRPFKKSVTKVAKDGILVGYRFGGETKIRYDLDVLEMYPLALKVMNAYIEDALEYKTLSPEVIANNNWRKYNLEKIQIYRGFLTKKDADGVEIQEKFKVPVEFLGFNEVLQKLYTQAPEENKLMIIPNRDVSSEKKSRGSYYYFIDLATGKIYYKEQIKGIKFKYFGNNDLEKLVSVSNSKYSTKKKKKK